PEPGVEKNETIYECFSLAYNPSMKHMEILNAKGTKEGLSIKISDPDQDYIDSNKHKVVFDYYRALPVGKEWEIVDVSLDFEDNRFIKIVLAIT
ncbi:phage head-tail adapter protein, partial [Enterococcus faecalis]|uniref:phage head-tail adapter protein n=1 Tax=Enterococcus faecalis TaxID=1351 RepID=UPI0031CD7FF4